MWNVVAEYEAGNIVTHDGSAYIAVNDIPAGTAITDTMYWQMLVSKGDTGEKGEDGADGAPGATATITIGKVSTLPAGSNASVVNAGTANAAL